MSEHVWSRPQLLVLLRAPRGAISHVVIGSALIGANIDAAMSMLPGSTDEACIDEFFCDTPEVAEAAFQELADLGDVEVARRDFLPRWFLPAQGSAAAAALLARPPGRKEKAAGLQDPAVRAELRKLIEVLDAASGLGCAFYLAEVGSGEGRAFAGPTWRGGRRTKR